MPAQRIGQILSLAKGYPAPKVDVRAAVFDGRHRILMVKETSDDGWSLPGG